MNKSSDVRCKICGGYIMRRTDVALRPGEVRSPDLRPWLHLNSEDWVKAPHDAEPRIEPKRECDCDAAEMNRQAAERNRIDLAPVPATSINEDGEIVCRFCWQVLNPEDFPQ